MRSDCPFDERGHGEQRENLVESRYSTTLHSGETEKQDVVVGIATEIFALLFYGIVRDKKTDGLVGG